MQVEVYLKKDIKADHLWEKNPHLVFGIYLIIMMILFFGGMFTLIDINCPGWLLTIYLIGVFAGCIALTVFRNDMCNISKSIAFLKYDQNIYMIKLGYLEDIDYQVMGKPIDILLGGVKMAHDSEVAQQVQIAEKEVRERRKKAEVYAYALSEILQSGRLPAGVTEFMKLEDAKVEKESKNFIWISFRTKDGRRTKRFRNAYDIRV